MLAGALASAFTVVPPAPVLAQSASQGVDGARTDQGEASREALPPVRGPIGATEQNPLYRLFHLPVPTSADALGRSRLRLQVAPAYSSIFERAITPSFEQRFDLERLSTRVQVRYGLSDRWEMGARVSVASSWRGLFDPLIEGLHDLLNVSNGDRAKFPDNEYALFLRTRDGTSLFSTEASAVGLEDIQVFAMRTLHAGTKRAASLRATVSLPTGLEGYGAPTPDAALELLLRRSWSRWHVHGLLGVTTLSPPEALAVYTRGAAVLGSFTLERAFPSWSALLEVTGGTAYFSGFGDDELDDWPLIVAFGVAGGVPGAPGWSWNVAFVEDIPPNGPSADVTLHATLSWARRGWSGKPQRAPTQLPHPH